MKNTLRKLCAEISPKGLVANLNKFLFMYRVTPSAHNISDITPAELFMGRRIKCQLDLTRPEKKNISKKDFGVEGKIPDKKSCIINEIRSELGITNRKN